MDKKQFFEVEMRANIGSKEISLLTPLKYNMCLELDRYFRYLNDLNKKWIVRLRKRNNQYFLTYKSNTPFGEGAWQEVNIEVTKKEAKKLSTFFLANEYIEEARIYKKRKSYKYRGFEINIDHIRGLGSFIEVEKMTSLKNIGSTKIKILKLMEKLGINKEHIIEKGYVALMKEKSERN